MNLAHWLGRTARLHPTRCAVALGDRQVFDFAQLASRSAALAGALSGEYDLQRGDRIAIACRNHPSYVEALFAAWWGGFVPVPVNVKLHSSEVAWIVRHADAKIVLTSSDLHAGIAAEDLGSLVAILDVDGPEYSRATRAEPAPIASRAPDDLAWLFYTSGTTGKPKGAMLTFRNLVTMSLNYLSVVDPTQAGDALLHCAPMSHGSGMYTMAHVAAGAMNVIPESGGFDVEEVFQLLRARPRTSMFAAPTMVQRLTDHRGPDDGIDLRTMIWGGAPMHVDSVRRAVDRFGPRLAQIYGQGESPMTIASLPAAIVADRANPEWLSRMGSAGQPSPVVDIRLSGDEGTDVAVGELGEVTVRGDTVMAGYWKDAEGTAAALRDGWLKTGDIGVFDEQGFLTLRDRSKDVIISGAANIYPREVEDVLLTHPEVREISVIGRPDDDWGEIVVAYVAGSVSAEELDRLCLDHLARFKRPKDYVFVPELPRSPNGKVLKTALRDLDRRAPAPGGS